MARDYNFRPQGWLVYLKTRLHGFEKAMILVERDLRLVRRNLRLAAVVPETCCKGPVTALEGPGCCVSETGWEGTETDKGAVGLVRMARDYNFRPQGWLVYLKTGLHGFEKALRLVERDLRLARRTLRLAAVVQV